MPNPFSTVFSLPLELFHEIFSYLADHRNYILERFHGRETLGLMGIEHVERSTTIRNLTMTCWSLRNRLLPLLWTDVEGCIRRIPRRGELNPPHHLYAQCTYLLSNPAIATYVQSVRSFLCN